MIAAFSDQRLLFLADADQDDLPGRIQHAVQIQKGFKSFSAFPDIGDAQDDPLRSWLHGSIGHGTKKGKIDSVGNDEPGVMSQIGKADNIRKPLTWRNDCQIIYIAKSFLFDEIIFSAVIPEQGIRIRGSEHGTFIASRLPFLAAGVIKEGALASQGPAVMESPDNRKVPCFDIFKQHSYMDIEAM